MDVRNCKQCSKLFNYIGGAPICPECATLEKSPQRSGDVL